MGSETNMNAAKLATLDDIPGWLFGQDQALISWFLERQNRLAIPGDLLELGAYLGKSAILIGRYRLGDQRLTVIDLFEEAAQDHDNDEEMRQYRSTLTRRAFERNYLAFHTALPTIVQGPTSTISSHVAPQSCRFVHVDASHLYEHVEADIKACRAVLQTEGLLVCDDFRAPHTPGVAAAVWGAVTSGGLRPICLSDSKFYGTWGDPGPVQRELIAWLETFGPQSFESQKIAGSMVVRIADWHPPKAEIRSHVYSATSLGASAVTVSRPRRGIRIARRVAREVLPPVITRALKALLR
jgi:predicted O-methyltransferase YrrM